MALRKRRSRFGRDAVMHHAALHHPNCPAETVYLLADDISMREWEGPDRSSGMGRDLLLD